MVFGVTAGAIEVTGAPSAQMLVTAKITLPATSTQDYVFAKEAGWEKTVIKFVHLASLVIIAQSPVHLA